MAVVDLASLSFLGSMDFKPLSLIWQGSALAMRLEICQWLGKKKSRSRVLERMNKREKKFYGGRPFMQGFSSQGC